jgi:F-type H+-transporting ATPase subunit alpha
VRECQEAFLEKMRSVHHDVIDALGSGKLDEQLTATIEQTMADISGQQQEP